MTEFNREEAEAMMEEYGYAKHSDCRDLVEAAYGRGYRDAKREASQARTDGGAVAEIRNGVLMANVKDGRLLMPDGAPIPDGPLYTTPPGNATQAAGAREPLTPDKVIAEWTRPCYHGDIEPLEAFEAGVRFAERLHGIASPAAELKKD